MSDARTKADAFVAAHRDEAATLGERLADRIDEPEAFVAALVNGLGPLTDADHLAAVTRACPQTPARYALRGSLGRVLMRPVSRALTEGSSMAALQLAQRLAMTDHRDLRLYALEPLRRALPEDPEMSWQLMRRLGRGAEDWIATDSLADLWARGILAEPFRWAELEQLLYSQHVYERRLVPATLATIPHRVPASRRGELRVTALGRALELVRQLLGDAEVMVQKALAWALREWTPVDGPAVAELLRREAGVAAAERDGARAWVIREALGRQPARLRAELGERLKGIRRDLRAPSTSLASIGAAAFAAALASSTDTVAAQGDRYARRRA